MARPKTIYIVILRGRLRDSFEISIHVWTFPWWQSVTYWAGLKWKSLACLSVMIVIVVEIHLMISCWQIVVMWGWKGYFISIFLVGFKEKKNFFCLLSRYGTFFVLFINEKSSVNDKCGSSIFNYWQTVRIASQPTNQPQHNNLLIDVISVENLLINQFEWRS